MKRKYFDEAAAFDPEAVVAMSKAFEEACGALRVGDGDVRAREIVATRIVDLARGGVLDANALRDRVLLEAESAA
jgi:hypothetical protein